MNDTEYGVFSMSFIYVILLNVINIPASVHKSAEIWMVSTN